MTLHRVKDCIYDRIYQVNNRTWRIFKMKRIREAPVSFPHR